MLQQLLKLIEQKPPNIGGFMSFTVRFNGLYTVELWSGDINSSFNSTAPSLETAIEGLKEKIKLGKAIGYNKEVEKEPVILEGRKINLMGI